MFSSSSKLVRNLVYDKTVLKETQWSVQKEQYRKSSRLWRTCTYQFRFEKFNVNYTELKTKLGKLIHVNVWIDLRLFKISCWFPRSKHICRPMRVRVVFSFFFYKMSQFTAAIEKTMIHFKLGSDTSECRERCYVSNPRYSKENFHKSLYCIITKLAGRSNIEICLCQ